MPIYRVIHPQVGRLHMQEWWRRVLHVVSLLLVTLAVCAVGLIALDSSDVPQDENQRSRSGDCGGPQSLAGEQATDVSVEVTA